MKEVRDFLDRSIQYFTTVGLDNKPKVRPFMFMIEREGKMYFCTSNKKDVFRELERNPWVELCSSGENNSWMRLAARVCFVDDLEIKKAVQERSELVKSIYKRPDNPDFEIFYLDEAKAVISDFSGEPPRVYNL